MKHIGKILGGIAVALPLVAFAFVGVGDGPLFGTNVALAGYGQEKVMVCHNGKNTLTLAAPAVKAHVGHGDTIGACK